MAELSDQELRSQLKELGGESVGPITATTRPIYTKKLNHLKVAAKRAIDAEAEPKPKRFRSDKNEGKRSPLAPKPGKLRDSSPLQVSRLQSTSEQGPSPNKEPPCSRYPVPDRRFLPQDMRDRIQKVEEKSGFLPNIFKGLSYRPDEFRAFFAYHDALMEKESDTLTKAEKEMIVVVTSSYNDCLYCVIAHGALHRIYSKNKYLADQLAVNWETADIDDRQRAILKFAMSLCKAEHVADEHIEELKRHGLTDNDVWDVGAITAFYALSNRMAHLTRMRPNTEFHMMGRVPHAKQQK